MKPILHLLPHLLLLGLLVSCDDDDNVHTRVPSLVLNGFHREFPQALEVGWLQRDSLYQVDYEIAGDDNSALLNAEGQIIGTKREISIREIPSQVLSGLEKNFSSLDLDEPEQLDINGETFYQLEVEKILFDKKIVLDTTGKINTKLPYWE